MKYFALLAVLVLALACGNKSVAPTFDGESNGGSYSTTAGSGGQRSFGTSGSGGSGGATGGEAGAIEGDALGPTVEITSPQAVADPTSGMVLTADAVTVTCSVTASKESGSAVLAASVKIQMFGADGKQVGADGSVMSSDNANEYAARFVLSSVVPTGAVSFTCSASDESMPARIGSSTVNSFYDGGPAITLSNPMDKSAHPLGAILFQFSALPSPLAAVDSGAAVTAVTLSVNGIAIQASKVAPVVGMAGYYQSDLDLSDPLTFTPKPAGTVPVIITATNERGTTATQNYTFTVDSVGPIITIVSPPTTSVQIIGGQTTIQFTVIDEAAGSGVNASSVQAQVNDSPVSSYTEGSSWHSADGKTFFYSFNTRDYPLTQLGVSITISAFDNAGNKAQDATAFYYLDNIPPTLDLQPPVLQEKEKSGTTFFCGEPFDPLGNTPGNEQNAPKDLATVPNVVVFRALLWDDGNHVNGQSITFFSDIDTNAGVRLFLQEDTTQPLLKNDGNTPGGTCNQIADPAIPSIPLTPVGPAGTSFYDPNAPEPAQSGCTPGQGGTPPDYLCNGNSPLTRVIQHETATSGTGVAVIYAFQADMGALCTGGQFDLTTKITKDGWICAAVAAQDKVGNIAVSAPIRLCLDASDSAGTAYAGTPGCKSGTVPAPTCIAAAPAGCVPPPHFGRTLISVP